MTTPRARMVAVGDELLEGRTSDTNSGRVQRALGAYGVQVTGVEVVPDDAAAVGEALERTAPGDLVFLTGGLGSTPDDLTREAVAGWAGVELVSDPELRARLEARWRRRGVTRRAVFDRQCEVPAGLEPIENPVGSAPGLVGELAGRTVVLLPGVPSETAGLLPLVTELLAGRGVLPSPLPSRIWRTAQLAELSLVDRCRPVQEDHPDLRWSWWLTEWGADVRLAATAGLAPDRLAAAAEELDRALAPWVFSCADESLPAAVLRRLSDATRTVAVAESCTGGLVGGRLTDEAGASTVFRGGVIAYADDVKNSTLDVPADVLADAGAVSEETVRAMAAGIRTRLGTDYGLAVSGISGPGGGTGDKPVGTTWLAIATPGAVFAARYRFTANRGHNRRLTVAAVLDSLRRVLDRGDTEAPWRDDDTWLASGRPDRR